MTFHARLTELIEKATKGPWAVDPANVGNTDIVYRNPSSTDGHAAGFHIAENDGRLIVYLVNHAEALRDLVVAAVSLKNEVGALNAFEFEIREIAGNTNYNCLTERAKQVSEALAKLEQ